MWLGMLAAAAGQVPGFPVEAAQRARRACCSPTSPRSPPGAAGPSWAYAARASSGSAGLVASYAALAAAAIGVPRSLRRRRLAALAANRGAGGLAAVETPAGPSAAALGWRSRSRRSSWLAAGAAAVPRPRPSPACASRCSTSARATRSCSSRPARPPVLVDGGPPGDGLAAKLRDAGVERLGAAVVTHEQSDHAGGIEELLGAHAGRAARSTRGSAAACAARPRRPAPARCGSPRAASCAPAGCGSTSSGRRRELLAEPLAGADPNAQALVLLARWRGFSMLLTADAEAEAVPIDPARSTCSRSPTTAATTPASAPCSIARAAAGGDLGRRGQPLRPSDARRRSRRSPRTACRPCAPTASGTIVLDVERRLGRGPGERGCVIASDGSPTAILGFLGRQLLPLGADGRWS